SASPCGSPSPSVSAPRKVTSPGFPPKKRPEIVMSEPGPAEMGDIPSMTGTIAHCAVVGSQYPDEQSASLAQNWPLHAPQLDSAPQSIPSSPRSGSAVPLQQCAAAIIISRSLVSLDCGTPSWAVAVTVYVSPAANAVMSTNTLDETNGS